MPEPQSEIERLFREEHGRTVAILIRAFGDVEVAEEAVQEAYAAALKRWPEDGLPASPDGWIVTTARNAAIDRLRREAGRERKYRQAAMLLGAEAPHEPWEAAESAGYTGADGSRRAGADEAGLSDDRLSLIFTCCHPALSEQAQVALTLRLLGGLTTAEIAHAFQVTEPTMGTRLSRAKAKIRATRIPFRAPVGAELPARLGAVLRVIYLIFNEGYAASSGESLIREDLCAEAIRLGRLIVELLPDEPEAKGLLALMLLTESRRPARTDEHGGVVLLADQDRSLWSRELIAEGQGLVRECLTLNRPGFYQLQAAINAVHSDSARAETTGWSQILALYDQLIALAPTPIVALNRAVAVAEVQGPAAALALVDELDLEGFYLFHAVRGDLLSRLDRQAEAAAAYRRAIAPARNRAQRDFLAFRAGAADRPDQADAW